MEFIFRKKNQWRTAVDRNSEVIHKNEEQVECLDVNTVFGAVTTGREDV